MPDHALERQEQATRADREETRQQLRNLHAREALLARVRVADEQAEAEREPGDVRERLAGPDGERRQHREDLAVEDPLELLELLRLEVFDLGHDDPGGLEPGAQVALPELRLLGRQRRGALSDLGERGLRRQPVGRAHGDAGRDLVHQPGHPDHEELVHVRGEDRAEVDALEQGQRVVACDVEHAAVEVELRQLPVQEPRLLFGGADSHDRLSSLAARGHWVTNSLRWLSRASRASACRRRPLARARARTAASGRRPGQGRSRR